MPRMDTPPILTATPPDHPGTYGYVAERWDDRVCEFLAFGEDVNRRLPPENADDWFDAVIRDELTGAEYAARHTYTAYEDEPIQFWDATASRMADGWTVHRYLYSGNWCPCHRIEDIESSNPRVAIEYPDDNECPDGRFLVLRMWHRAAPNLVLYRERWRDGFVPAR
jgi:hypothetical protein